MGPKAKRSTGNGSAGWRQHGSQMQFNVPEEEKGTAAMLQCGLHVRRQTRQRGRRGEQNIENPTKGPAQFAALTEASVEHEQLHARAHQHAGGDDADHDLEERTHLG